MSFFDQLKSKFQKKDDKELYKTGLDASKASFGDKVKDFFMGSSEYNDDWYDHLLAILLQADLSLSTAEKIIKKLRKEIKRNMSHEEAFETFAKVLLDHYGENHPGYDYKPGQLNVMMIVGVNGSGKTTTAAKLAYRYQQEGKKVLLVGGDTFRAAGSSQLGLWAEEVGVDFVGGKPNQDPASVYVDAARYAKEHDIDIMICDSAGRLQNKTNLMNELDKMRRVLIKEAGHIDHTYLVIDGNTGQNGLMQAKAFTDIVDVDSLIVTKLDGSPKGGVIFSINDELKIKVSDIGLGEKMADLRPFDVEAFVYRLVQDEK
ncbi:MAG TPA: signal recognition particle-docking protein FtsY [Erysipelothrix sp.]